MSRFDREGNQDTKRHGEEDKSLKLHENKMSLKITNSTKTTLGVKAPLSIEIQASHPSKSNLTHPLASLYKKSESQESKPSFRFFPTASGQDDSDIEQTQVSPRRSRVQSPLTPFTKRDLESRVIRSPAPTPDTAYHNKHFIWPTAKDRSSGSEEDRNEKKIDSELRTLECKRDIGVIDVRANDTTGEINTKIVSTSSSTITKKLLIDMQDTGLENIESQSEFQKWFWANQGQINRGWKKRRKLVMKGQRQKDKSKKA